jgi:hypothetical protein
MPLIKVHITLDPNIEKNQERRSSIMEKVIQAAHVSQINQKRFDRYGIITGMVDESLIDEIGKIQGILSVEQDKERFLY